MARIPIKIVIKEGVSKVPTYSHEGDSGFDLIATNFKQMSEKTDENISSLEEITIPPGHTALVGTDLYMEIPYGYELQVRSRSGNSLKKGFIVANSPGTVDSTYRGEIGVILLNTSNKPITVSLGDKIAQGVLSEVPMADFIVEKELNSTNRGEKGYGSTDNKN